ncbi:hypothetical protein PMI08_02144 [Brevibacillus sp. CF112]|uniref:hypothetical protein n=1 Tax=Brevibacillus TaxID=55080 RepID=UPI000271BB87|nr:hypothetical protein [Brevibacillus sp. CF112]EJL44026.1 hypothetical protein PMI08_02144 [Brevibacillus sp. CF112]
MTLAELKNTLEKTGFPVTYSHFTSKVKPPFICFVVAYSTNFMADNEVYQEIENVQIELYTIKKDPAAERKVKEILQSNGLPYETTEIFIDSEKLFQKIFEVSM